MPTVPNEILFAIIDFLGEDFDDPVTRKTQLALRLTNRAACDASTPYAFRCVKLRDSQEAAMEQMEGLSMKGYGRYISRLSMDVSSTFPRTGADAAADSLGQFFEMVEGEGEMDNSGDEETLAAAEKAGFLFEKLAADGFVAGTSDILRDQTSDFFLVLSRFLASNSSRILSLDIREGKESSTNSEISRQMIALRRAMAYGTLSFALACFDFKELERVSLPARGNFTCPSRRHMSRTDLAQEYLRLFDKTSRTWDDRLLKLQTFRVDYMPDKFGSWGTHRYRTWGHHKLYYSCENFTEELKTETDILGLLLTSSCRDVAPARFCPLVRLRIDDLSVPGPELLNAVESIPGLRHLSLRSITLARYDHKLREGVRTGAKWSEFFTACRSNLSDLTVLKLDRLDYGQSEWPSEAHYPMQSEHEDDFYRLHELVDTISARRDGRGMPKDEQISEVYPKHITQRLKEILEKRHYLSKQEEATKEAKEKEKETETKRSGVRRLCHKIKKTILSAEN